MITSITIKNFKSFRDETQISFEANDSNAMMQNIAQVAEMRVMKTAILFGANASGKTTVYDALEAIYHFVVRSQRAELDQPIPHYHPFRLNQETAHQPTKLALAFLLDQSHYVYSVEFNQTMILTEKLSQIDAHENEIILYARTATNVSDENVSYEESFPSPDQLQQDKTVSCLPNQLYISKAAQNGNVAPLIKAIFRKIKTIGFYNKNHNIESTMVKSEEGRAILAAFLHCADTGINAISYEEREVPILEILDNAPPEVKEHFVEHFKNRPLFHHDGANQILFDREDESDGTQKLYELVPLILHILEGNLIFADELDSTLHPRLVSMIIRLINDPEINTKNGQLLLTAHSLFLMNNELFRPDQVLLTQKNAEGATDCYPLDVFEEVDEYTDYEAWYREGRFDAIPHVDYCLLRNQLLTFLQAREVK